MTILYSFCLSFFLQTQEIPFKPKDEFEIKLQYEFKQRPISSGSGSSTNFYTEKKENSDSMLPYLILHIKILKATTEQARFKVTRNLDNTTFGKHIEENGEFEIDMGFTDDMKDRVTSNEYTVHFLTAKKQEISRIVIFIDKDGTFLVNGEKRGKF